MDDDTRRTLLHLCEAPRAERPAALEGERRAEILGHVAAYPAFLDDMAEELCIAGILGGGLRRHLAGTMGDDERAACESLLGRLGDYAHATDLFDLVPDDDELEAWLERMGRPRDAPADQFLEDTLDYLRATVARAMAARREASNG